MSHKKKPPAKPESTYQSPQVCAICGKRVFRAQATMYPSNQMGEVKVCPSHGIQFEWELWGEAEWIAQRKPFLDSKAGRLDIIGEGDR